MLCSPARRRHPPGRAVRRRSTRRAAGRRADVLVEPAVAVRRRRALDPCATSSSASTSGWASRSCSRRHARVSLHLDADAPQQRPHLGRVAQVGAAPAGRGAGPSASRAVALGVGLGGRAGRGPTMPAMIASATPTIDGQAVGAELDAQHLGRRLGPGRRRAPAGGRPSGRRRRRAGGPRRRAPAPPSAPAAPASPPTRRPATPGAGGRRRRPARRARRAPGPGRTGRAGAARGSSRDRDRATRAHTTAGSARQPPWTRRCTAARSQPGRRARRRARRDSGGADHHTQRGPIVASMRRDVGDRRRRPRRWPTRSVTAPSGATARASGSPRPTPRGPGPSPPVEQTADVRRLAGVLDLVVGDADQPHAERHRRVPPAVDDRGRGRRASSVARYADVRSRTAR